MRRRSRLLGSFLLLLCATPLLAQRPTAKNFRTTLRTGIGYTAALPGAEIGVGAFRILTARGTGVFVDAKKTSQSIENKDGYCPTGIGTCNVAWVESNRNDPEIRVEDEFVIFNVGLMHAITPELAVMVGGGPARVTRYREFLDENPDLSERLTPNGSYYVDDPEGSGWVANFVGAFMLRAGPGLTFRAGYETAPSGMSLGVYLGF